MFCSALWACRDQLCATVLLLSTIEPLAAFKFQS